MHALYAHGKLRCGCPLRVLCHLHVLGATCCQRGECSLPWPGTVCAYAHYHAVLSAAEIATVGQYKRYTRGTRWQADRAVRNSQMPQSAGRASRPCVTCRAMACWASRAVLGKSVSWPAGPYQLAFLAGCRELSRREIEPFEPRARRWARPRGASPLLPGDDPRASDNQPCGWLSDVAHMVPTV